MTECETCEFCVKHFTHSSAENRRRVYHCRHIDQKYIENYFREKGILKMPGCIGFSKPDGSFPVKNTPKWCPKRRQNRNETN